jgi:NAD(P)-dependent dehydrogenase (short-subunit alcohol dehydrogenase family)
MTQKINGNILVTGAATGVGLAITRNLSKLGYSVFAAVLPGQDTNKLQSAKPARIIEADLGKQEDISHLVETVKASGELIGIISNAGIAVPGPIELIPIDQIRLQYEINVFAPIQIIQGLLPNLRKSKGRIIIIGAGQSRVSLPYGGPYGSSKTAISALADSLRAEVYQDGIQVSVIEPGAIKTDILKNTEEKWSSIMSSAPKISSDIAERYRSSMDKTFHTSAKAFDNAMEPDTFAEIVVKILNASKPKPRYLIGREAKVLGILSKFPDKLRARILTRLS